jgi:hypothetical protein
MVYEGAPNAPNEGRFWEIIEKYKVTIFYTAPTAIRSFIKWGDKWVDDRDLSSLRLLGSVGEGINPEAWMWYHRKIGGETLSDRRYVVANRNRRDHDEPATRRRSPRSPAAARNHCPESFPKLLTAAANPSRKGRGAGW